MLNGSRTSHAGEGRDAAPGLRLGALAWHFGWSGFNLLGVIGLMLMRASPEGVASPLVMAIPGAACVLLLWRDTRLTRRALIWIWAVCAGLAVWLGGGIAGPQAMWVAAPMLAAVVLNQRSLISLGAALAFVVALLGGFVSLWGGEIAFSHGERLVLSLLSVFSTVIGLGVALLPALRARFERAAGAEDAREKLFHMLTEQPALIVCLNESGRLTAGYGEAPAGVDLRLMMQLGVGAAAHVPDRLAVRAALETAQREGRAEIGFTPHAALDHYVALSLRKGADGRLYGVLRDASLQHAHEAALEAARGEAEAMNAGKTRFVASMSHELRTPLNAVIGFSDIMRQKLFGDLPPKYAEYAQLIWESGQHVLDLINDILDMSKIEAQKYELTLESFDAREPASQSVRLMRGQAHDKGVEIVVLPPPGALNVRSDRRAIKQICLNLLSNAIKFTPRGGQVTLEMKAAQDSFDIVIRDTGIGIGPEDLSRIGQPYEQGGSSEQRAQGTGLGLSIVKAMAHMLGGTTRIDSTPGEGTCVTVTLPLGGGEADAEQPSLPLSGVAPSSAPASASAGMEALEAFARAALHPAYNPLEDIHHTPRNVDGFGEFVIRPPRS